MPASFVSAAAIGEHYKQLNGFGGSPESGFNRPAYSDEETAVINYFRNQAAATGLLQRFDSVGNLIIETAGTFSSWIETGSHVDTVPAGGNYDGLAGVVAGLEALRSLVASGLKLRHGLRLRIWRGEESASFGIASIGSRAGFGVLPPEALKQMHRNRSLADAMRAQQADPECIAQGTAALGEAECNSIAAYIELHIEQGKLLESNACDIGIVTAIRGARRSRIRLHGRFDHSGATPMGSAFRQDCNLAMAHMQVRLDALLKDYNQGGGDLVQTVGIINDDPTMQQELAGNAVSKISGAASFSFEIRGCEAAAVDAYMRMAEDLLHKCATEFGVQIEIDSFSNQAGIGQLDASLQALLANESDKLGYSHLTLPSGAWHDAGSVAQHQRTNGSDIPAAMIFIPCRSGISHSPHEFTSIEQIAKGATLLAAAMRQLAQKDEPVSVMN